MKPYTEMYRRWTTVPGVQAAGIAVLSALYTHADRDGICTATQGELAEELKQSRAWIHAILKSLQEPPVALVAARTRRGYRGFLYELTGATDPLCQPADSQGPGADLSLGTGNPLNPESSSSPGERGNGERNGALPVDWQPDNADLAWAGMQRPDVDPASVTGKFVAWCRKAHGRNGYRPADPGAAWRRWIARELVAPIQPPDATDRSRAVSPSSLSSSRRDFHHERRSLRPLADQPGPDQPRAVQPGPGRGGERGGSGLAARNHDTLAALRHRLARPA